MAEVAGIVIGLVPIVLKCLKSYRSTRERLESFRDYTRVISEIQLRLSLARASFRHSCQLLLENVVDVAHERSDMVKDPQHKMWQEESLDRRFRDTLGHEYEIFEDIFNNVLGNLCEAQKKMEKCIASPVKDSAAPSTIAQRFQTAFHVSRKENQYGKWLDELDKWNERLKRLIKQRLSSTDRQRSSAHGLIRKAIPQHYIDVSTTAQRLHDTLHDSWSCTNVSHTGHQAKLALDPKPQPGGVQLDVVIACRRLDTGMVSNSSADEFPIWLYVKSTTTYEAPTDPTTTVSSDIAASAISNIIMNELHEQIPQAKSSTARTSNSGIAGVKRKLKRVRLNVPQDDVPVPASICDSTKKSKDVMSGKANLESFVTLDLKATKSICDHLSYNCASAPADSDPCLGYLEDMDTASYKIMFYNASQNAHLGAQRQVKALDDLPIDGLLPNLHVLHQLTLAHKLAMATLQYHSTLWLPLDWSLHDIAYFNGNPQDSLDDIAQQLRSLHLSTQFPKRFATAMELSTLSPHELKRVYGIRNLPLAKLGVALLEICHQKTIGSLVPRASPHDVISARELLEVGSSSLPMLGPKYLSMAQKCIDCDFACGNDLRDADLQSAVYTEVVCVLEGMIVNLRRTLGIQ